MDRIASFTHRPSFAGRQRKRTNDIYGPIKATTRAEWVREAIDRDVLFGLDRWKDNAKSDLYDYMLITNVNMAMKKCRVLVEAASQNTQCDISDSSLPKTHSPAQKAVMDLANLLLGVTIKSNLGGIENAELYSQTHHGTKRVIDEYYDELFRCLSVINASEFITPAHKLHFFKLAHQQFGVTALCLSGGASLGYHHYGVMSMLHRENLLPRIIGGTSAGSFCAAYLCVRTDEELEKALGREAILEVQFPSISLLEKVTKLIRGQPMFGHKEIVKCLMNVTLGKTTFLEAYRRTGRVLNVTVVADQHGSPQILNYRNAPHVMIYTAILASASIPAVIDPTPLLTKLTSTNRRSMMLSDSRFRRKSVFPPRRGSVESSHNEPTEEHEGQVEVYTHLGGMWRDGGFQIDIPTDLLSASFNVKYTIVSQVNPMVLFFAPEVAGSIGAPNVRPQHGPLLKYVLSCLNAAIVLFKTGLKANLELADRLCVLPAVWNTNISTAVMQKLKGSVTIMPPPNVKKLLHLVDSPSEESIDSYLSPAVDATWPKLHMIENRLRTEFFIEAARKRWEAFNERDSCADGISPFAGSVNFCNSMSTISSKSEGTAAQAI